MSAGSQDPTRDEPSPLPQRAHDDSDVGWGERTELEEDERRYREERPPHHGD